MTVITLPWPHADLSPNARAHWRKVAPLKRRAKHDAWWLALEAGVKRMAADRLNVSVTFYPPDNRRRDTDNMLSSSKALLDGIAEACGVDDSRWVLSIARCPAVEGGKVVVKLGGDVPLTDAELRDQIIAQTPTIQGDDT